MSETAFPSLRSGRDDITALFRRPYFDYISPRISVRFLPRSPTKPPEQVDKVTQST